MRTPDQARAVAALDGTGGPVPIGGVVNGVGPDGGQPGAEAVEAETVPLVLVAHGSRAEAANEAHAAVADALAQRTGRAVHPAFLELAEPSIPDAIVAAAAGGARRVEVLPHFLYPGRHLRSDIPALVAEAEARLDGVQVALLAATGDDEAMLDLLVAQVEAGGDRRTMF